MIIVKKDCHHFDRTSIKFCIVRQQRIHGKHGKVANCSCP